MWGRTREKEKEEEHERDQKSLAPREHREPRDAGAPLLRKIPTQVIEHVEFVLVPTQNLHTYSLVF